MPSQGPRFGATITDNSGVGSIAWTNPTNAGATDDAYTTITFPSGAAAISHYLKVVNFKFGIPRNVQIQGIQVEVEKKSDTDGSDFMSDSEVKLVGGEGSIYDTDRSKTGSWSTTEGFVTYGGPRDLWGTTIWTSTLINDNRFGMVIAASVPSNSAQVIGSIDSVRITIFYDIPGGSGGGMKVSRTRKTTDYRIGKKTKKGWQVIGRLDGKLAGHMTKAAALKAIKRGNKL